MTEIFSFLVGLVGKVITLLGSLYVVPGVNVNMLIIAGIVISIIVNQLVRRAGNSRGGSGGGKGRGEVKSE